MYPDMPRQGLSVAVPLNHLAELWGAYYWPFMDEASPIYQVAKDAKALLSETKAGL